MPTHKVIARVALMPADRKCAELEGYNMLLRLDKGLYFFFFYRSGVLGSPGETVT